MIDITEYEPGRFAYLMKEPFAKELWDFLSNQERLDKMMAAIAEGKPAIYPILHDLEKQFGSFLESDKYPEDDVGVLANNMMKQLLDMHGYEHIACGLCPQAKYIKHSGVYAKKE